MLLIFNIVLELLLLSFALWLCMKRRACAAQEQLLSEQERFLDELAGQYAKRGDMLEALEESMQISDSHVRREVLQLMDALKADGYPEDSEYYGKHAKNAYFLLLFTLCDTIRNFGDMQIRGVSLFVHNIRYIKEEVRIELLRRQEGRYAFLGLIALSVIPFFFSLPIQWWSVTISADMSRYYNGTYGFVTLLVCFFLAVFCAFAVQELQYPTMNRAGKDTLAQRLLQVPVLAALIDLHIAAHYSRYLKKNETLKVLQGFGNIREFLVQKLLCALGGVCVLGMIIVGCLAVGSRSRLMGLPDARISVVGGTVLIAAAAAIGYVLPDVWVFILQARTEQQKTEETLRFETMILIVMHYGSITVEELLRWMERFSVIFSRALQRAVDDFSYRRRDSLEQLKDEFAYEPAKKLVDSLIVCDDLPIAQAFYDLEGERAYHMEQYRQKAVARQREKAAVARVLAFLPFVALLALRLIVPFVLEGLTQLGSY